MLFCHMDKYRLLDLSDSEKKVKHTLLSWNTKSHNITSKLGIHEWRAQ